MPDIISGVAVDFGGKVAHPKEDAGDTEPGYSRLVDDDEQIHRNEVSEGATWRV